MRGFVERFRKGEDKDAFGRDFLVGDQLVLQVNALFGLLADIFGSDRLVLRAGKLEALHLMRSDDVRDRVLALERIVFEDPTIEGRPDFEEIPQILDELQSEIAEILARRTVEEQIEKKIAEKMQERHEDYVREIRLQVLKEDAGPDNAQTLKKYAELEILDQKSLAKSALEAFRPRSIDEVIGQDRAVRALMSKIASPYPQHVILYGPPGVGKTTVARLALEAAKKLKYTPFDETAKFVEVDGTTLRWDPREVTNPLLGSVHDPIYQGARRDLAESGIPEPKLGLVTEAHGGILFIDEIGEMDLMLQNKLLKVLEDKRVYFDSAYYDPEDPNIPKYIKKLFEEGAPADFILIGATTRDPSEINPALRSRCAEVYFEPLTPADIQQIVKESAERIGVKLEPGVAEMIADYTIEGRQATRLLADAYGIALYRINSNAEAGEGSEQPVEISIADLTEVLQASRLTPYVTIKASDTREVGHVFGLGVAGFLGSVIEIEAVAFPAREKGKGQLRFNETAGSMAKDSVFNAVSVLRRLTGKELSDYDIHVNVVGGGRIDGPSAGAAILIAIISAVEGWPVYQNVAMTGEISIQGKIRPIGGVYEKIFGAKQAGIKKVLIPQENTSDIPPDIRGIEIVPVATVSEAIPHFFGDVDLRGENLAG
ncbi:MAG: ATP-dependent protease, Lon family [Firmicutes bacterium]|nr:ATP-dependent protease, Lon family [Bacillota bacterium]